MRGIAEGSEVLCLFIQFSDADYAPPLYDYKTA